LFNKHILGLLVNIDFQKLGGFFKVLNIL